MFIFYFYKCWKIKYGLTSYSQKLSERSNIIFNAPTLPLFLTKGYCVLSGACVPDSAHLQKGGVNICYEFLQ